MDRCPRHLPGRKDGQRPVRAGDAVAELTKTVCTLIVRRPTICAANTPFAALFFVSKLRHSNNNKRSVDFQGRTTMKRSLFAGVALLAAVMLPAGANAQETIKIGVISAYSGQFADTAAQIDNGIKLYMKQHGDTVAGKKIEIIRKDSGGPNPDVAKRLAQELVVRDKADILAGFTLTPEALGAAGISAEAKKLMVDMNAATSIVTEKSPYIVRVSLTLPQISETLGTWAATKGKIKKAYTMVTDFGPGIDAETAFQKA